MKSIHDQRYIEVIALLRQARERSGYTQGEVAETLGKPQSYVSKVETCERRVDVVELLQLCQIVGITLAEIIPTEFLDVIGQTSDA